MTNWYYKRNCHLCIRIPCQTLSTDTSLWVAQYIFRCHKLLQRVWEVGVGAEVLNIKMFGATTS